MGALFVGFLTTYSYTYSGGTKALAPYYARRYITPMPQNKAARVKRIGAHLTSPLKIQPLRFALYGADDSRRSPEA